MDRRLRSQRRAENDIYTTFVDSLFTGGAQLATGAALQVLLVLFIGAATGAVVFGIIAASIVGITALRIYQSNLYNRQRTQYEGRLDDDRLEWSKRWENRFSVSTAAGGGMIGLVVLLGLNSYASQFVTIACLTLLFAYGQSVIGRLYGSKKLACSALLAAFLPPCLGLVFQADILHVSLVGLLVPYGILVVGVLHGVREPVRRAVLRRHEVGELANRFDIALNTMSHGLIMLTRDNVIEMVNNRARDLLNLSDDSQLSGRTFASLLRYFRRHGHIEASKLDVLNQAVATSVSEGTSTIRLVFAEDQAFEFSIRSTEERSVLLIEDVTERVRSLEKIKYLARFDHLTGLPNRNRFVTLVEEWQSKRAGLDDISCGLIIFDLDDFKLINDSVGHIVGDKLLKSVGERLKQFVSDDTFASRLGGDEFLVFVGACGSLEHFEQVVTELNERLSGFYQLGDKSIKVSMTFGGYRFHPFEATVDQALAKADMALYEGKREGRGTYKLFAREFEERVERRSMLERDLEGAIDRGELQLRYQPLVSATTGRIVSCEALCRWDHPSEGAIPPSEFISIAEENGMIWPITSFVLRAACANCAGWAGNIKVSVNLSVLDFQNPNLLADINSALAASGLDPSRLVVELTETAVMRNRDELIDILNTLRAMGIKVALDDFGTGYSSLGYLASLPVDHVKIDRSFVAGYADDPKRRALLNSVTSLCRSLHLPVTLEGVETYDELELVSAEAKPDLVQGWVFGAAMPPSAIAILLDHAFPLSADNDAEHHALVATT